MKAKWNISPSVTHDLTPALFAESFVKARCEALGIRWNAKVRVTTTNTSGFRGYRGRAWRSKPGTGRILVRIANQLPDHEHKYFRFNDMPSFRLLGDAESIVYIFAHEFGHVAGYDGSKSGEISCCKLGYATVQAWRDRQYDNPACLI